MIRILLFISAFFFFSCGGPVPDPILSPSGHYSVTTEISGADAGPDFGLCVRLKIVEAASGKVSTFQTGASDTQKWALDWSPDDTLILYSSDIGTYAYELTSGGIVERLATKEERDVGRNAYERKYGRRPIG